MGGIEGGGKLNEFFFFVLPPFVFSPDGFGFYGLLFFASQTVFGQALRAVELGNGLKQPNSKIESTRRIYRGIVRDSIYRSIMSP
jgi:hypothetical protein